MISVPFILVSMAQSSWWGAPPPPPSSWWAPPAPASQTWTSWAAEKSGTTIAAIDDQTKKATEAASTFYSENKDGIDFVAQWGAVYAAHSLYTYFTGQRIETIQHCRGGAGKFEKCLWK